jgi:hypothetical protein
MLLAIIYCLHAGSNLQTLKATINDWANITDFIYIALCLPQILERDGDGIMEGAGAHGVDKAPPPFYSILVMKSLDERNCIVNLTRHRACREEGIAPNCVKMIILDGGSKTVR